MCGISGYLNLDNGVKCDLLRNMTNIIRHRGPDDEGYALLQGNKFTYYHGNDTMKSLKERLPSILQAEEAGAILGFGHRRLSILDLSDAGHQPMERDGVTIVYNGEIYNYVELTTELQYEGYEFYSRSDTEVILAAYDMWGSDCVHHFNGMWSFAIYDSNCQTLFLSRDRYGVKPLYYYRSGNTFLFGSEIKQLLEDKSIPRKVNREIMAHHLLYEFREYSEQTFFEDIFQLRGGHNAFLKLDLNKKSIINFSIRQYYSIYDIKEKNDIENPALLIGEELTRSIKWRLRSDVKMGSCLSGGLDSSSMVAIACEELKKIGYDIQDFETFTSSHKDSPEIDETEYSSTVAEHCGCKENYVYADAQDLKNSIEKISWHQDEPAPNFLIMQWKIFEKASQVGCKVLFDGQGGDETLAGYDIYYANYLYHTLKQNGPFKYLQELKKCVQNSSMTWIQAVAYTLYFNFRAIRMAKLKFSRMRYLGDMVEKNCNTKEIEHLFKSNSSIELQQLTFNSISIPGILHWDDRDSMAHSLEVRLPFLDYQYVAAALSVPIINKINNGYTKVPLREFVNDKIPRKVVWRKNKMGFPVPGNKWIYELDPAYIIDLLDNAKSEAFFCISRLKKQYLTRKVDTRMFTKFILVEVWMRVFDVVI